MKTNLILLLGILFTMNFAFALPGEEGMYENNTIAYSVERIAGEVDIAIHLIKDEPVETIEVMRSEFPTKNFRTIKEITGKGVDALKTENTVDKYPFPNSVDSYYKVVTVNLEGVKRSYPAVKLVSK